jgi:hypothetical protein
MIHCFPPGILRVINAAEMQSVRSIGTNLIRDASGAWVAPHHLSGSPTVGREIMGFNDCLWNFVPLLSYYPDR